MGIVEIIALIGAVVPILTPLIKKLLKSDEWDVKTKKKTHAIIPLVVGILGGILACQAGACEVVEACSATASWGQCILAGLAGGAGGSYVRDFDKNVLGLATSATKVVSVLTTKKK